MENRRGLDGWQLKYVAMVTMLIDHVGAIFFPEILLFRLVGRLAFPIFAFGVAEGMKRTHNPKKYVMRMCLVAVLAEIPFDLAFSGAVFDWNYQNVLWTFLIAQLVTFYTAKLNCKYGHLRIWILLTSALGWILGEMLRTDYGGWGALEVLLFFYFYSSQKREENGYKMATLWIMIFIINVFCLPSADIVFGRFYLPIQMMAIFSMGLIAMYNGTQGKGKKWKQYACYAFYPVHLLFLAIITLI